MELIYDRITQTYNSPFVLPVSLLHHRILLDADSSHVTEMYIELTITCFLSDIALITGVVLIPDLLVPQPHPRMIHRLRIRRFCSNSSPPYRSGNQSCRVPTSTNRLILLPIRTRWSSALRHPRHITTAITGFRRHRGG